MLGRSVLRHRCACVRTCTSFLRIQIRLVLVRLHSGVRWRAVSVALVMRHGEDALMESSAKRGAKQTPQQTSTDTHRNKYDYAQSVVVLLRATILQYKDCLVTVMLRLTLRLQQSIQFS